MDYSIKISDLALRINQNLIFGGVDLQVPAGEIHALIGVTGVGKSQLLRAIAGINDFAVMARGVTAPSSFVFQNSHLVPWLNVWENLKICAGCNERKLSDWLQEFGLLPFKNYYPYQLSGGMKQKVNLIRAFASNRPLILLDEPFIGLDFSSRGELYSVFFRLWQERRTTALLVSHDVDEAILLSQVIHFFSRKEKKILPEKLEIPWQLPRDMEFVKQQKEYLSFHTRVSGFLSRDMP